MVVSTVCSKVKENFLCFACPCGRGMGLLTVDYGCLRSLKVEISVVVGTGRLCPLSWSLLPTQDRLVGSS